VWLEDARDRQRGLARLERHLIVGCEALGEELELLGLGLDPSGQPQPGLVFDRDLAEITMHIQRDRSHVASFIDACRWETRRAKRQRRIRARSTTG
jgi:hypothetical protein